MKVLAVTPPSTLDLAAVPVQARPSSLPGLTSTGQVCARTTGARGKCDGRLGFVSEAGVRCVPAESTELQRARRSGPGGESGAPGAAVAPRADADVPAVRAGLGETLPVCAALHRGQRCVLVSNLYLNSQFVPDGVHIIRVKTLNSQYFYVFIYFAPKQPRVDTWDCFCSSAASQRDSGQLLLLCNATVSPVN